MAPFAGNALGAIQKAPVDHDAAADARAEDGTEDDPPARAGPVACLRQGEAVGVIGEPHRPAEMPVEILAQGAVVQPVGIGIADAAGGRAQRAGVADTDSRGTVVRLEAGHQGGDHVQGSGIVMRGGHAFARQQFPAGAHRRAFRLGSAQIDADTYHDPVSLPFPLPVPKASVCSYLVPEFPKSAR